VNKVNSNKEFIFLDLEVVSAKNKALIGIKGKVVDETKNTFKIKTKEKTITVLKQGVTFKIGSDTYEGNELLKRTFERLKG
tara:strand:+ start:282 stop:524 length:243 start_codon:yes stop_codon:yes gene_type:complete